MSIRVFACALVLGAVSHLAHAAPVLAGANRMVLSGMSLFSALGDKGIYQGDGAFDDAVTLDLGGWPPSYFEVTGHAEQHTLFDLARGSAGGTGFASIMPKADGGSYSYAQSAYELWFDLDDGYAYTLTGQLGSVLDGGLSLAFVELERQGTSIYKRAVNGSDFSFSESGLLTAGRYHLQGYAVVTAGNMPVYSGSANYAFDLQLNPLGSAGSVPEPPVLALLALALPLLRMLGVHRNLERRNASPALAQVNDDLNGFRAWSLKAMAASRR